MENKLTNNKLFLIGSVVLIALLFYVYCQVSFPDGLPWSLYVHSGVHADYVDFSEWYGAIVIVLLGRFVFRIHYPFQLRTFWWGVLIGLPTLAFMLYANWGLIPGIFSIPDFKPLLLVALLNSIEAGVTEEFIFRGTLLPMLQRAFTGSKHPLLWPIGLSALIFGAGHLNFQYDGNLFFSSLNQAVGAFGMGVLVAALTICTKSLLPGIVLHAANNFLPNVSNTLNPVTFLYTESFHPFNPVSFAVFSGDAIFQILLACLIYWVWHRHTLKKGTFDTLPVNN